MNTTRNLIKVMPESLANKIAAGEVVERPISIVKELVENAIDAKSSTITIIIKDGGKQLIEVIDDGMGMSNDDAILSVERHATSKLVTANDLTNISSMGFRGEALSAISSVSQFSVTTCDGISDGTFLLMDGGTLKTVKRIAASKGTKVSVKKLFYNVPARKKFLKSTPVEFSHIMRNVTMEALARPDIQFRFFHNNRSVFRLFASSSSDRAALLLGPKLMENLRPISAQNENLKISGFISTPSHISKAKRHQYTFINKRPIKSTLINRAIYDAFKSKMAKDSHPSWVLYITIGFEEVDVNVHPNKEEVRFASESQLFDFIKKSIEQHLSTHNQTDLYRFKEEDIGVVKEESFFSEQPKLNLEEEPVKKNSEIVTTFKKRDTQKYNYPKTCNDSEEYPTPPAPEKQEPHEEKTEKFHSWDSYNVVGQIFDSFILVRKDDELLLIDQHAAHERILYEKIKNEWGKSKKNAQMLLTPITIPLTLHEKALVEQYVDDFTSVGFDVEPFGPGSCIVRSVPNGIGDKEVTDIIMEILDMLKNSSKIEGSTYRQNEIHIRMACRSAIKASCSMSRPEMNSLVYELSKSPYPYTCPHGRPTVLKMTENEIRKHFYRNKKI